MSINLVTNHEEINKRATTRRLPPESKKRDGTRRDKQILISQSIYSIQNTKSK